MTAKRKHGKDEITKTLETRKGLMTYGVKENGKLATGRPSALTDELVAKLEEIFKSDGSVTTACSRAGIQQSMYYRRLKEYPRFKEKMEKAQQLPYIYMNSEFFKTIREGDLSLKQRGAIEWLRRRDRRYSDKIEQNIDMDVDAEIRGDVKLEDKSIIELEKMRQDLLGNI